MECLNLFELYFSARKRYVKWCDDRERRRGVIQVVFTDNAYTTIMAALQEIQGNLDDHLDVRHAPKETKKETPPLVISKDELSYQDYIDRMGG